MEDHNLQLPRPGQLEGRAPSLQLAASLASAAEAALAYAQTPEAARTVHDRVAALELYFQKQHAELVATNLLVATRVKTLLVLGQLAADEIGGPGRPREDENVVTRGNVADRLGVAPRTLDRYLWMARNIDPQDVDMWVAELGETDELSLRRFVGWARWLLGASPDGTTDADAPGDDDDDRRSVMCPDCGRIFWIKL